VGRHEVLITRCFDNEVFGTSWGTSSGPQNGTRSPRYEPQGAPSNEVFGTRVRNEVFGTSSVVPRPGHPRSAAPRHKSRSGSAASVRARNEVFGTSFKARGFDRSTFQISRDPLARTSAERDPESEMRESETALPAGVPEAEPAVQCPSRLSFDEGSGAGFGRSVRASRRSIGNRRESP